MVEQTQLPVVEVGARRARTDTGAYQSLRREYRSQPEHTYAHEVSHDHDLQGTSGRRARQRSAAAAPSCEVRQLQLPAARSCCSKKVFASSALAGAATPAKTASASRAETIIFMVLLHRCWRWQHNAAVIAARPYALVQLLEVFRTAQLAQL